MRIADAPEIKRLLDAGAIRLLDVRLPDEIATAAIAGSLDIPLHELPQRIAEVPQDKPVAVICHHGVRSQTAAKFLEKSGFAEVASVDGGIDAWSQTVDSTVPRY